MNAGTLHLDDDLLTRGKGRAVCLCNACRAERRAVNSAEHLVPLTVVLLLHNGEDDGEGEGARTRLQFHQLVAVFGREKVGAHAHDLPELHKGGTEILEDGAQLRRGQTMHDVVAAQNGHHFAQAQGSVLVLRTL